jgi:hypothetical protein
LKAPPAGELTAATPRAGTDADRLADAFDHWLRGAPGLGRLEEHDTDGTAIHRPDPERSEEKPRSVLNISV